MRILESIINNSISGRIRPTNPVAWGKVLQILSDGSWMYEHSVANQHCLLD
jgi:hypothetical protein